MSIHQAFWYFRYSYHCFIDNRVILTGKLRRNEAQLGYQVGSYTVPCMVGAAVDCGTLSVMKREVLKGCKKRELATKEEKINIFF